MADLYLTPAEKYTAALGGFYSGDLPEPGTVYTQLIKDILNGSTPDKVPKNILARFIYSLYISDLGDPYPRYELAKLLYWKLHDITPTKSGSILAVTIDGKEDYMTINTDLSILWYKVLFGSKTDVITEFPYIFNTMQNKLSDWDLFGNTVKSGTPTPDNPVMPNGCGDMSAQLIPYPFYSSDGEYAGVQFTTDNGRIIANGTLTSGLLYYLWRPANFQAGTYTMSVKGKHSGATIYFRDKTHNVSVAAIYGSQEGDRSTTFTVSEEISAMVYINAGSGTLDFDCTIMLNSSSEALPYEPYGYKIPISSASTTTPVYLGEVETTRKIKKLVLTGEEFWQLWNGNYYSSVIDRKAAIDTIVCSHFINSSGGITYSHLSSSGLKIAAAVVPFATSVSKLKAWLAAQYAAGTPVTVWYVLAIPETGIVNEPLMKIGDYADSLSRAQTGIDIPTVVGQNTLDVLTTVKPSSMRIEYTSADETKSRSKRISLLKSPMSSKSEPSTRLSTDRKIDYPTHIENAGVDPDVIK